MSLASTTDLVKCIEVARFLGKDSDEVRRMTEEDDLPAVKIPAKTKNSLRIYLPDFHTWLIRTAPEESKLRSYPEFLKSFRAAQARPSKQTHN
jgi:hypothetical protein